MVPLRRRCPKLSSRKCVIMAGKRSFLFLGYYFGVIPFDAPD
jgi:hypothetical protein